jgi:predicted ATPase/DNA-binding CsgD family transcriptional regulator/tetratricopeptide (TPR) repeat protein
LASTRADLRTGNLPVELTSFVGRRQELADLKRALASTRLLTLTGTGGVGKTKLALRAGRESARQYPDGVWFVELAPIQEPELVVQAVFTALGLQDHSASWAVSTLSDYLADKRPLLILDNCEHVHDAAAVLAGTLLRACPDLRILATSRQALGVTGEVVIDVPTLSLPEDGDASPEALLRSDAVALFVERASAVQHGFAVDAANSAAIRSVCTHVEGIPLALELAAVRLNALGLDALDRGLGARLGALGTGDRSAAPRQQTLEGAIDWSYELLSEQERLLWARLSVFSGGFELDAAQAVCAGDGLDAEEIPGLIGSLVEKSVLKRRHGDAADRFRLLEPLRQFGRERLREAGAEEALRARHRDWIGGLARAAGADDARQVELFRRVRAERANVWAAIDFCLDDPAEAPRGVTICSDLWVYWTATGPVSDIRRVFAALLLAIPAATPARARALSTAGVFAFIQNDYTPAGQMFAEAATIGRDTGDADVVARSLAFLSSVAWVEGRSVDAVALADESLNLARAMHLRGATLHAHSVRGYAFLGQGDVDAAIAIAGEGVRLSEELGETWERGILFQLLAGASLGRGDRDDAAGYAQQSVALERDLDDRIGLAHTIALLASIEMARKSASRAATLLGGSEAIFRSIPSSLMEPFRDAHQRAVDDARDALGEAGYLTRYAAGLEMTRDEVVDYALELRPSVAKVVDRPPQPSEGLLSRREMDVAELVADGATNAQVATRLFISERTVESHLASVFNKLGVDSRLQVARWVASTREAAPA